MDEKFIFTHGKFVWREKVLVKVIKKKVLVIREAANRMQSSYLTPHAW